MGHPLRNARPGYLFHDFNRGNAHRTVIDGDVDGRAFLALLADLVHRGEIKVRAFCLMMTHFHLLVESVNGRLGDSMRRLEGIYARGFNRRRPPRDGHLLRGRYRAKRVVSEAYQSALFDYIDRNPVEAGLVTNPADYPFGSARLYGRTRGPAWLDRTWAEAQVCRRLGLRTYVPEAYSKCFGLAGTPGQRRWFESLMSSPAADTPSLDELVRASPEHILRWMNERALDADGTTRQPPIADLESIARAVADAERRNPEWAPGTKRCPSTALQILLVGLLRDVGGQTFTQIGGRASIVGRSAAYRYEDHRRLLASDERYRAITVELAGAILRECHGGATSHQTISP